MEETRVGCWLGAYVDSREGMFVDLVGVVLGSSVGCELGNSLGSNDGILDCTILGVELGSSLGCVLGNLE
jgi:hypothetical protein